MVYHKKRRRTDGQAWSSLGYASSCVSANATQVGGVVDRKWLICAQTLHRAKLGWNWPTLPTEVTRPLANCLRPVGVPGSAYRHFPSNSDRPLPDARNDFVPAEPGGTYIKTAKGSRRLLHNELCNGLGVPKPWVQEYTSGKIVQRTVALHLLEHLTPTLLRPADTVPAPVLESLFVSLKRVTRRLKTDDMIVSPGSPRIYSQDLPGQGKLSKT
jgi:hypothetical protein